MQKGINLALFISLSTFYKGANKSNIRITKFNGSPSKNRIIYEIILHTILSFDKYNSAAAIVSCKG